MKFIRYFALIVLFTIATFNAFAGGIEPTLASSWSGLYIGLQLGHVWSRSNWQYTNANYFNTLGPTVVGTSFNFHENGTVAGGMIGFNHQIGILVLGIEGSFLATNLESQRVSPFFPAIDQFSSEVSSFANVKARIGLALARWLIYINGGYAGGNATLKLSDFTNGVFASKSQWANGWTLGMGVDFKLTPRFILGAAYNYIQLNINSRVITCPNCGVGVGFGTPAVNGHLKNHIVSAKVSYLFP